VPKKPPPSFGILCDTGFLIRLNDPQDDLHLNARGYLKHFLKEGHPIFVSTIALAEYAVKDQIDHLPMKYFRVLPFNIDHAQSAGEFASVVYETRSKISPPLKDRKIISNDTKMFSQAHTTPIITHYLTADQDCESVYNRLKEEVDTKFQLLHLQTPVHQAFGFLNLDSKDAQKS